MCGRGDHAGSLGRQPLVVQVAPSPRSSESLQGRAPHACAFQDLEGTTMTGKAKMFIAVGAAFVLGTGAARANERQSTTSAGREQAGDKATSADAPSRASEATSKAAEGTSREITGRVLQAGPSKLFLEHMGAVVEFNLKDTEFSGGDLKSSRDLAEGQQVKASFTVENKTTNIAKRVSLAGEAGTAKPSHEYGPGEHGPGMSPGERPGPATPSTPGMPPREPGTTPAPK